MIILTIRTDKPEAEVSLYDKEVGIAHIAWQAHRELSVTIHDKIRQLLDTDQKGWADIEGIVVFKGPGSFTGLRIGISLANALAYGLRIPVVGKGGKTWAEKGINALLTGKNDKQVSPHYGAEPHITKPRK